MQYKLFIHIGYPKAGSKTLQANLFGYHPDINYLGPKGIRRIKNYQNSNQVNHTFFYDLVNLNGIQYYFKYNNTNKNTNNLSLEKVNVLSHEEILKPYFIDNALKANRLYNSFPEANIIIIIRNQIELLRSIYDQLWGYSMFTAHKKLKTNSLSYKSWLDEIIQDSNILSGFDYYKIVTFYKELFGEYNVGVFYLRIWQIIQKNLQKSFPIL